MLNQIAVAFSFSDLKMRRACSGVCPDVDLSDVEADGGEAAQPQLAGPSEPDVDVVAPQRKRHCKRTPSTMSPPGPSSLAGVLDIGAEVRSRLLQHCAALGVEDGQRVASILKSGVFLTSSYSGMGTAELAASMCAQAFADCKSDETPMVVTEDNGIGSDGSAHHCEAFVGVLCHSCCDNSEVCQDILLEGQSRHVFQTFWIVCPQKTCLRCRMTTRNIWTCSTSSHRSWVPVWSWPH